MPTPGRPSNDGRMTTQGIGKAIATTWRSRAVALGVLALDVALPASCLKCDGPTDRPGTLCGSCWTAVHFLTPPWCAACGFPFPYDLGPDTLCAGCAALAPVFARARAALAYDEAARPLVTRFKYHDRQEGAATFARWMARAGDELLNEADLIAPVPLHPFRLLARRFNQAAILTAELGALTGKPFHLDVLRRVRQTRPQVGLSPAGRRRNVAQAFQVRSRYGAAIRGARILLVDDVLTTGATVEACARALRHCGARQVDVLTLARVVAGRALPI